jgi:hypothetical protein
MGGGAGFVGFVRFFQKQASTLGVDATAAITKSKTSEWG